MLSKPRLLITLFLIFALLNFVGIWIYKKQKLTATTTDAGRCSNCLRIGLPQGVTKKQVISLTEPSRNRAEESSKEEVRRKIYQKVNQEIEKISKTKTKTPTQEGLEEQKFQDYIVILVDKKGKDILPNAEKLKTKTTGIIPLAKAATLSASNELTFSFDSAWTNEERQKIQSVLDTTYPVVKQIYGPPFFSINVRINKFGSAGGPAYYFPSTNTIVFPGDFSVENEKPVIVHEMIHAFHDDFMIAYDHWEEGMTQAVTNEIEDQVFHMFGDHWAPGTVSATGYYIINPCFRYSTIKIPGLTIGEYNNWACAWGKLYSEGTDFFRRFNSAYFPRVTGLSGVFGRRVTETTLKQIVYNIKPNIEGQDFYTWFTNQYVFKSPTIETGQYKIRAKPRIFKSTGESPLIKYVYVGRGGTDILQTNAIINIKAFDSNDNIIFQNLNYSTATLGGYIYIAPPNILGIEKVRYELVTPNTKETVYATGGIQYAQNTAQAGFFGVVDQVKNGRVLVYLAGYRHHGPVAGANIVNGTFTVPPTGNLRGRFRIMVLDSNNRYITEKTVTKNYGDYAVIFE